MIAQVSIEIEAFWLVEGYIISQCNHPAQSDYDTEAILVLFKIPLKVIQYSVAPHVIGVILLKTPDLEEFFNIFPSALENDCWVRLK